MVSRGNVLSAVTLVTSATDSLKKTHQVIKRMDIDETWFLHEWKFDELMDVGTAKHVVCFQRRAPQHFVIDDNEAQSDLSLGSRSFLHRVNDQVRKRKKLNGCNSKQ